MNWQVLKAKALDAEHAALSAADCAAAINAETVAEPIHERLNYTAMLARLTPTEYRTAKTVIKAAIADLVVEDADRAMQGEGLDFSHENTQAMLDLLFDAEALHALRDKLKGLGFTTRTWAEVNGCTRYGPLTAAHIERARNS